MDLSELSIRDLLGVAAVAAHGHFGRAAASLRIAQPTLSAQVVKVETTLGVTLFERTARKFLITPDGQRLLPLVRELLAAAERLEAHAGQGARERAASPFRLGVIPTLGPYLMPYLLLPLRREHPRLRLSIAEHQTAKLLELLLDGTLDAAFLSLPVRHHSLEALPLFDEPFRLIAPVGSAIAAHKRLLPSRLAACDMILLGHRPGRQLGTFQGRTFRLCLGLQIVDTEERRAPTQRSCQGSKTATPVDRKSDVFRVHTVRP